MKDSEAQENAAPGGTCAADCSASEEKRLRGNVRFFCDEHIPWCEKRGHSHEGQDAMVRGWNEQLKAAGLEPEPTPQNAGSHRQEEAGC